MVLFGVQNLGVRNFGTSEDEGPRRGGESWNLEGTSEEPLSEPPTNLFGTSDEPL